MECIIFLGMERFWIVSGNHLSCIVLVQSRC